MSDSVITQTKKTSGKQLIFPQFASTRPVTSCMPLIACFLLAVIVRVWLIVHTNGVLDGDEATVGIQAEHILRGQFPVYYYGQAYLGSFQAYVIAFIFLFTGPAVWAMRIEPIDIPLDRLPYLALLPGAGRSRSAISSRPHMVRHRCYACCCVRAALRRCGGDARNWWVYRGICSHALAFVVCLSPDAALESAALAPRAYLALDRPGVSRWPGFLDRSYGCLCLCGYCSMDRRVFCS